MSSSPAKRGRGNKDKIVPATSSDGSSTPKSVEPSRPERSTDKGDKVKVESTTTPFQKACLDILEQLGSKTDKR